MRGRAFLKAVTVDRANALERFLALMRDHHIAYCIIGGQAVNAYVEPLVSLDLDVVVASDQIAEVEALLREAFHVQRFPHSLDASTTDSDVRIQVQTDPRYAGFVTRAQFRDVLGHRMSVAALDDVLRGKVWAAQDTGRRGSKRQKDLADIARIVEANPELRVLVPKAILDRLI